MQKRRSCSAALVALVLVAAMFTAACDSWERQTFNTLAASQKVIDQAGRDYNAGTIARTQKSHDVIESSRAAQSAAVESLVAYERVKVVGSTADVATQQQAVVLALSRLPQIVVAVKGLYEKGGTD